MENLKIRVNNEAESKEALNLLRVDLKYGDKCFICNDTTVLTHCFDDNKDFKEITLPELRDLVVLKRNDVGDATHTDGHYSFYVGKDKNYFFSGCHNKWESTWKRADILKPIEKPMKEYLRKNSNGTYSYIGMVRPEHVSDFMIEIPKGANFAWKSDGKYVFFTTLEHGYRDAIVVWQRPSTPEELPFIDDEPEITTAKGSELDYIAKIHDMRDRYDGESDEDYRYQLEHYISRKEPSFDERIKAIKNTFKPKSSPNDQYAEIETVRQSAWQKQEGGSHYKNLKIQPMQYALENKLDYAQANVVKYVTRHKEKNGKEDLLKAIHNIELMIEFYYGGGE